MRVDRHLRARYLRAVYGALMLACCTMGCQAPPASTAGIGSVQRLAAVKIMDKPYNLLDSPVYPMPATSHILRWKAGHFEWDVSFYRDPASYASIRLKKPLDLRPYRPKSCLRFRLNPDAPATNLYVGLADRRQNGALPVMVRMPLAGHRVWSWKKEGFYAIPLSQFAAKGPVLSNDEKSEATETEDGMEWGKVGELRIGMLAAPRASTAFRITYLEIGPTWQISDR